jgi:hypothetical protein
MGLDMYAYTTREQVTDYGFEMPKDANLIQYWRKHPDLHGWMEALYRERGGDKQFNCIPLCLTLDDIKRLEVAVKTYDLPETDGFFFGESLLEHRKLDLAFIRDARKAIKQGYTVFYDSWW